MSKWRRVGDWPHALVHFREENGQALAEYGLVLALIAAVCIVALTALGLALAGHLDALTAVFP